MKKSLLLATAITLVSNSSLIGAPLILDDFNVSEGHFNLSPTFSGSTAGILTSSTADRVSTSPVEGTGCEQLLFYTNNAATVRVRFLSGSGSAGNNTAFTTSAAEDGWIGFYLKTTNSGWDVQLWLEGASNNGGTRQEVIPDGEWHLYEWDLDNTDGTISTNGWGDVTSIVSGSPTVADGSHTIDSIIFRNRDSLTPLPDATNLIYLDFVAKTDSGSVSNVLASLDPCINTEGVLTIGPISASDPEVTVTGVSASATAVTVYQDSGPGGLMLPIGVKTSDITAGNNQVGVSGLVKTGKVVATQTVNGQESCVPASSFAITVGGGANPSVRMALTIRETTSTGPVGDPGISTSANLHFLGATTVSGGAPVNASIVYPSNGWQTVTFLRGTNATVGDPNNAAGTSVAGLGYPGNDTVSILVYALRTLPNGTTIYSASSSLSAEVSSNDVFNVNWTWDAAPEADGYRVIRSTNFAGYYEYRDVPSNNLNDDGTGWTYDFFVSDSVLTTTAQVGRSVQWNPSVSNTNNLPGQWGILESISFAISDLDDTGPFNLYIDDIENAGTVFQDFELAPAGTSDYGFRAPRFSGTTSASLLTLPNVGEVSNEAAESGTKSFHVQFQWSSTNATRWLRLTTSGVNNPQVNLDEPISFRLLMLPVGAPAPTPPAAPLLTISKTGNDVVLDWPDGHRLQSAVDVTGPYANVPQNLSPNVWTNVTQGAFLGPWTNNYSEPTRFFRLAD